jgi:NADPH:quinone reductase-like Zn-dependent oxidoreductase
MKAIVLHSYGGPEVLKYEDFPDPIPSEGDVLVRTAATSVNPFDFKVRSGAFKDFVPIKFPAILGLDVSGIVEAVGPGVTSFRPGDKVFAHKFFGLYAELCLVKATDLAKIPEGADVINAAALPTVTTTGAQLASLALGGKSEISLLVTGAAGSVGRSAIYWAKSHGAKVIAGVLKRHLGQAVNIGADAVVALDDTEAVKTLDSVDAVADTVGGPTADEMLSKVRPGGTFASVLGPPSQAGNYPQVQVKPMEVAPDTSILEVMATAVQKGTLTIPLGQRFSLADAGKAHAAAEKGSAGKILLLV